MSKKRAKQMEAKRARKAAYGIKENRTEREKAELNPNVPYQRRKLERRRGVPMKARPPRVARFIEVRDGAYGVKVYSPGFRSWLSSHYAETRKR